MLLCAASLDGRISPMHVHEEAVRVERIPPHIFLIVQQIITKLHEQLALSHHRKTRVGESFVFYMATCHVTINRCSRRKKMLCVHL
jgi:hypothetical protein